MTAPLRILHCHSTFALGGKEARAVRLMNAWGPQAEHVILSATDQFGARDAIDRHVRVDFPQDAPSLAGLPGIARYRRLSRYMRGFDLVLTYNWGSMDAVMARRLFGGAPLIHHEDGFNADEADGQKAKRVWFRRLGLGTAAAVVVPSFTLERIAQSVWRQPASRVRRIANGIPTERYADGPDPQAIPGFVRRDGEVVVGTLAGLRGVKDLPRLVRLIAPFAEVRLVIVGEGPERAAIEAEAARLGVTDRVLMPGFLPEPARVVGHFDILALTSLSEQQPISVIEGMAAGLPILSTDVGDVAEMVTRPNRAFVTNSDHQLNEALAKLVGDPALRRQVGASNRERARTHYDERGMIAAYAALYAGAAGRPGALDPSAF
ncbi:glycosyltransferase family 4 protein [Sphingomonas jatrophae]|uniref:Glycosyltransferase involved in cell wall bisynthesis n=1 Tax=Sphingomonas jatrophae TaxID=1166337 RepID=A0A1I6JTU4_9SPHN|nr:glycosyltransferase family 4 protein [Sphingomonas jatrophae]SFR82387.1 Glycosyltransferase involved in cell wall bisynthesis [Sphingomonas jatrophae]